MTIQVSSATSVTAYQPSAKTNRQAKTASFDPATVTSNTVNISQTAQDRFAASQASAASGSISQQAQSLSAASEVSSSSSGSRTYDFTNMTPNQMAQLQKDGKVSGPLLLTEAQFQLGIPPGRKPTQSEVDAANNTPTNYIQLYTHAIQQSLQYGHSPQTLQNELNQMKALQGTSASAANDRAGIHRNA